MEKEKEIIINDYYNIQNERLDALRHLVKLGPIDSLKVKNAINQANKLREVSVKCYPNESIDADYTVANDLEYTLRFNAFMRMCNGAFKKYQKIENDGYGLEDFAISFIDRFIEEKEDKEKENKRKVK